jgi:REP element-mobilizing transposase RayT
MVWYNIDLMVRFNSNIHHRRSVRLREYDYSSNGYYFVTICTQHREHIFGEIVNGKMALSESGKIVDVWWRKIFVKYDYVLMDEYVIMPNHMHGIMVIVGAGFPRPQEIMYENRILGIGQIIAFFKYQTTKVMNVLQDMPGNRVWQRNYYERVIRCGAELKNARQYIIDNPRKWVDDVENIQNDSGMGAETAPLRRAAIKTPFP